MGPLLLVSPVRLGWQDVLNTGSSGGAFLAIVLSVWVSCNFLFFRFVLTAYTSVSLVIGLGTRFLLRCGIKKKLCFKITSYNKIDLSFGLLF